MEDLTGAGRASAIMQARARPSNTTIRELLTNDRYTRAVLDFLGNTRVGEVKEGVICK